MTKRISLPLQSIRFICAVLIFLYHLPFFDYPQLVAIDARILSYFFSPLTFFFILSGWALTNTYYEKVLHKTFNIRKYFEKRLLRLYPIHIITLLLSIPLVLATRQELSLNITLANIFLIHAFIPSAAYLFSYNPVSWSLSVFLFLYIIFPYIQIIFASFDQFIRKYALVIALLFVFGLGLYVYLTNFTDPLPYAYDFSPFERLIDFMVGVCIYFIVNEIKNKEKINQTLLTFIEFIAVSLIIAAHWYAYVIPMKYVRDLYFILPWATIIGVFSFSHGFFSKILSWKPLVTLGSISLEFFLTATLSIEWVYLFLAHKIQMNSLQKGIVAFFVTIVTSFILHYVLLNNLQRYLARRTR